MSLHSKLVPVQYREYDYGLFVRLHQANEPATLGESAELHNFDTEHQSEPERGKRKEHLNDFLLLLLFPHYPTGDFV